MSGRQVVITGGSRGIGLGVARSFVNAGDRVAITGREPASLDQALAELGGAGAVEALAFDVTEEAAVAEHLGEREVDVLVVNAGAAESAPLQRTSLEQWERLLAINATGAFLCIRAVLPGMCERDAGRIVTVASVASHRGTRYTGAYTASKHALLGLTRAVAVEVAGSGVTVNAVCPAYVDTPMTDRTIENIAATTGRTPEQARAALEKLSPLGRLVTVDEVAAAVRYLASEEAAAVNGQSIVLDGGGIQL